jgi:hypothetical protein
MNGAVALLSLLVLIILSKDITNKCRLGDRICLAKNGRSFRCSERVEAPGGRLPRDRFEQHGPTGSRRNPPPCSVENVGFGRD